MIRVAILLGLFCTPATAANELCAGRSEMIALLSDRYGERQMVRSMEARGAMIEVYVSPEGTWTMLVVPPTESPLQACIVATGTGWMMIAPGIAG